MTQQLRNYQTLVQNRLSIFLLQRLPPWLFQNYCQGCFINCRHGCFRNCRHDCCWNCKIVWIALHNISCAYNILWGAIHLKLFTISYNFSIKDARMTAVCISSKERVRASFATVTYSATVTKYDYNFSIHCYSTNVCSTLYDEALQWG